MFMMFLGQSWSSTRFCTWANTFRFVPESFRIYHLAAGTNVPIYADDTAIFFHENRRDRPVSEATDLS